tara:strand:- start:5948 stop:6367 length:420 start_codon:yes stop_codon:yes gene_type:complete
VKKYHKLNCKEEYDFISLAINSHIKAYKLCWWLNKTMGLSFELTNNHVTPEGDAFVRYKSKKSEEPEVNLLLNRSKKGYILPSQKKTNYFLIINKEGWKKIKQEFLTRLRTINDILLVFEIDIKKEKNSERLVIYDKEN